MFVAQNAVDSNQANDELLCPPGVCGSSPKLKVAREWQSDYANKSRASMVDYLSTHPTSAVFMPACFDHTGDLCMDRDCQLLEWGWICHVLHIELQSWHWKAHVPRHAHPVDSPLRI